MENQGRTEIQLGHMCNNRCVFCVSGQRTERREALPLLPDPILGKIKELRDSGGRHLTFLGGEPTLQPAFMQALKYAVSLGFEEVVVHTNGVKTARASFVDEILAVGGNISFRLSFQGGTKESHELTTQKDGSFNRLVESMKNITARDKRISINMCVVESNYASVAAFPELFKPYNVWQVHLDMMRPLDSGDRTPEEIAGMIPRYSRMRPHLEEMVAGFPEGFDVNIGNLPYCIAPKLARWIHHDGETTFTVAIDGDNDLSDPWNKYENKKRDKVKIESCRSCVFEPQCGGFFETYRDVHGTDDFQPVTREMLEAIDPDRRLFTIHFRPVIDHLLAWTPPAPFEKASLALNSIDHIANLSFKGPAGNVVVAFTRGDQNAAGATDRFSMEVVEVSDTGPHVKALLRALFAEAVTASGSKVVHPVGDDAVFLSRQPPRLGGLVDQRLSRWMRVLRTQAPFGELAWRDVSLTTAGREATLLFADGQGGEVRVKLAANGAQLGGSYELVRPEIPASDALKDGLRRLFGVLKAPPAR